MTITWPHFTCYALDIRSLGLFRVMLGIGIVLSLFTLYPYLDLFYSNDGVLPADAFRYKHWYDGSLHVFLSGRKMAAAGLVIQAIVAILFAAGLYTRVTGAISFILLISLHHRFPAALNNGDNLLVIMLFWSFFLPLNGAFSLYKNKNSPSTSASDLATLAYSWQIALMYIMAVILKNNKIWLFEASAVFYTMNNQDLVRTVWNGHFAEFSVLLRFASVAAFFVELILGLAILYPGYSSRLRYAILVVGISLHASFLLFLDIGVFPVIDIIAFVPFIPSVFWNRFYPIAAMEVKSNLMTSPIVKLKHGLRTFVLCILITCVILYNARVFARSTDTMFWATVQNVCNALDISQTWSMFSVPATSTKWVDIKGLNAANEIVDVDFPNAYTSAREPARDVKMYSTHRMQKYIDNLTTKDFSNHRRLFFKWICKNYSTPGKPMLDSVYMVIYKRENSIINLSMRVEQVNSYGCSCTEPEHKLVSRR